MKPGTKLKRIMRNSASCKVFVGNIYTIADEKDGWIMLKERIQDGYTWNPSNFEVVK